MLMAEAEAHQYQEQLQNVGVGKPGGTLADSSSNKRRSSAGLLAKAYQAGMARLSFGGSKRDMSVDDDDFDDSQVGGLPGCLAPSITLLMPCRATF